MGVHADLFSDVRRLQYVLPLCESERTALVRKIEKERSRNYGHSDDASVPFGK